MIYNRIPVMVGGLRKINLPPIMYQYDQVQKLILTDIELPESFRADFCNEGDTESISMVGTADGVEIPNQLLQTGKPIKAFIVLSGVDANAVETRIDINIPVNKRPPASDIEPTPAEQTTIDTLIEAMNTAVEDAETAKQGAKDAQQAIEDMTVSAETLAPGSAATVTKTIIEDVVHLLFGIPRGDKGAKGDPGTPGATGNGIASITLISTSGLNKTYRITYTNGNHFDYVVTDGEKGDTGNGIYSIYKTGTSGKVDTYTILFTDGNTTDFTVTNGNDGTNGVSPGVTITTITGGHRVTITDADHPSGQSFDVMDGQDADAEHVTYDSTQAYSSGTVGNALNQLNSDITDLTNNKAPIITDTASGAIASFPDGAENLPIKQLTAQINPVQDLHGYDNPWPAGGGKNLLDPSLLKDQSAWNLIELTLEPNTQYTASCNIPYSGSGLLCYFRDEASSGGSDIQKVYTGHGVTVTSTAGGKVWMSQRIASGTGSFANYNVQIEKGSSVTTFAPYSNICPITGRTQATIKNGLPLRKCEYITLDKTPVRVRDTGISFATNNLVVEAELKVNSYSQYAAIYSAEYIGEGVNTTRIIMNTGSTSWLVNNNSRTGNASGYSGIAASIFHTTVNAYGSFTLDGTEHTYTPTAGTTNTSTYFIVGNTSCSVSYKYLRIKNTSNEILLNLIPCISNDGTAGFWDTVSSKFYIGDVPQNVSATNVTDEIVGYDIKHSNTIPFPDGAGTVYGAKLTVNEDGTGVLTADRAMLTISSADLSGTYNPSTDKGTFWYTYSKPSLNSVNDGVIAERFKIVSDTSQQSATGHLTYFTNGIIRWTERRSDSSSTYNTWLAENPIKLTYRLKTPLTYSLTAEEVGGILTTLKGENNVWADTGNVELEYRADTKLYLEKLTAPTEDDLIADHAIASGTFFMIGNTLYKATAAIANGAAITVGTNATQLSLADALNQLNS